MATSSGIWNHARNAAIFASVVRRDRNGPIFWRIEVWNEKVQFDVVGKNEETLQASREEFQIWEKY